MSIKRKNVLPGFGLTLGYTIFYLCLIVLIPLSALVFKTATLTFGDFVAAVTAPRVVASYRVTFGAALLAASISALFGVLVAWGVGVTVPWPKIGTAALSPSKRTNSAETQPV